MNKKIMTVDDSPSVRQMVGFTLKEAGYEVVEASDGVDALDKLDANRVHMVIADLNMPRMGGLELVRRVRALPAYKFVPVVMLTTDSHSDKKTLCRLAGATGWMVKPFKPEQLLSLVEKVLGCQAA